MGSAIGKNTNTTSQKFRVYDDGKRVVVYNKPNLTGTSYALEYGSYNSRVLRLKLFPDNIFSLEIPPLTKVKLYGGGMFDYGGKGGIEISNIAENTMVMTHLPEQLSGAIRSIAVIKIAPETADSVDQTVIDQAVKDDLQGSTNEGFGLVESNVSFYVFLLIFLILIFLQK
jgi:hypothetical protein